MHARLLGSSVIAIVAACSALASAQTSEFGGSAALIDGWVYRPVINRDATGTHSDQVLAIALPGVTTGQNFSAVLFTRLSSGTWVADAWTAASPSLVLAWCQTSLGTANSFDARWSEFFTVTPPLTPVPDPEPYATD